MMFNMPLLIKDFNNPDIKFFLLFDKEQMCGYAKVQLQKDKIILDKIYLLQSHQHKGLGSRLLNHCLEYGLQHQVNQLDLTVYRENAAAIEFYKKQGFAHTATLPYHAANGLVVPDLLFLMVIQDIAAKLKNASRPCP